MADSFVSVENRNQVLFAIRRTNRAIKVGIERESGRIANTFVGDARRTASGDRQAAAAAQSLRARKGIVPKVAVGGSFAVSTSTGTKLASNLWWGSEWGSGNFRQFQPWQGVKHGRWFYRTLRRNGYEYVERWIGAVDDAISRHWRLQGGG